MINFFAILIIIFIGILLLVFKKRSFKKFINKSNLNSIKLKALKIAEELADKSTLPILRKGLRDVSPEVIEISALLIRKFK